MEPWKFEGSDGGIVWDVSSVNHNLNPPWTFLLFILCHCSCFIWSLLFSMEPPARKIGLGCIYGIWLESGKSCYLYADWSYWTTFGWWLFLEKMKDKTMAKKSKFSHKEKPTQITYFSYLLHLFLSLLSSTLINTITNIKISIIVSIATAKCSKHLISVRGSTISQVHCLFRLRNSWLKVWKSWSRRSCSFLPLASVSYTITENSLSQINPNIFLRYVASFWNSSGFLRN